MTSNKGRKTYEMRQSQLVLMYGPGAMIDLPDASVLIGGLEDWKGERTPIKEERLERWLQARFQIDDLGLYKPPIDTGDVTAPAKGIVAYRFPLWFLGQVDEVWQGPDGRRYRTRPLIPWVRLVKGCYFGEDRKSYPIVPVRFVQGCVRGHLSDIDWFSFLSEGRKADRSAELWLDEGGAGNDFSDIFVRNQRTGQRRPLADAEIRRRHNLGPCRGQRPWLGPRCDEACEEHNRLLTRLASNAYFAQTIAVISIPDDSGPLKKAVESVWEDHLSFCKSEESVKSERERPKVKEALAGYTDAAIWQEIQRRKELRGIELPKGIRQAEIETLLAQKQTLGEDKPEGDFYARRHLFGPLPAVAENKLERLILIHKLREVVAQIGFTRFEASFPDIHGELDLDVRLAPLSRELRWLPAYENRGEGVFVSFSKEAIQLWQEKQAVKDRGKALLSGFAAWQEARGMTNAVFPGVTYIMLHSLAHLMITALSLDCGYSASSLRERIYASDAGYGILLYTGTSGSEGTLGGLVEMGKNVGRHLERALELGRLCSNDPICAQHHPASELDQRYLHGAACHGCLLIAETSCERRNELLDRALVIPTVSTPEAAFFLEK